MCGICGYTNFDEPQILASMCAAMRHRGPDDEGQLWDRQMRVGFGHRRLSIIDVSSAGHQPMTNEDGSIWVAFNGEIYDFTKHRKELSDKGHRFTSKTDTEVLVHLYEEKGVDFVNEINGMFAVAIWDGRKQQLVLARDHAGIKPLYYTQKGESLFFASEIKALMCIPGVERRLNYDCIPDYLTYLYVPGERTMLKGIKKLEPGHILVWKDGNIQIRKWFTLDYQPDFTKNEEQWIEEIDYVLKQAVCRQMVSDVPVGFLLSGGLDSSSLAALSRKNNSNEKINCYTAGIDAADNIREGWADDYSYAKQVSEKLDLQLKSFILKADVVSMLPKMVYALDEPDADPAVFPSYLISKAAREDNTKVLLSGTGADEIFFGYNSHLSYRLYRKLSRLPKGMIDATLTLLERTTGSMKGAQNRNARRAKKFRAGFLAEGLQRHIALCDWSGPVERFNIYSESLMNTLGLLGQNSMCMGKYYNEFMGRGELNRHSHILIQTFLAAHNFLYTDKSSMAASVEVRVPFMDLEVMKLGARIPESYKLKGTTTKYILKKAMEKYLPREVIYRSKTGFGAPLRKWISMDLQPMISELLSEENIKSRGLFNPAGVEKCIEQNRQNKADHSYLIYALLTLELWMRKFIDAPPESEKENIEGKSLVGVRQCSS